MNEMKFSEFELMPEIQHALDTLGFENATDIQASAIPLIRDGRDIIGRSQTGTGKTFAFAIPAIEKIDRTAEAEVQVLILCPTRELAQQGCAEIKKLTRYMQGIWPADVYGGAPMERQIQLLKRANLVIGTPGRVMDHMRRGTLSLEHVNLVVLDEADEMLSMGFVEDIETILSSVSETRQTVLFSATMPDSILALTEKFQNDPQIIEINKEQVTLDQISQQYMDVPMGRKLDALLLLLHSIDPRRTMIFCNTKMMVDEVASHLNKNGFTCEAIHGDMNQSQRTRVMEGFKASRLPILVATDVAARGIDVNDVDYVINYDIPQSTENYVHRIGRTGRAGKEGHAITICSGRRQVYNIRDIERETKSTMEALPIPTVEDIRKKITQKNLESVQQRILDGISDRSLSVVSDLLERGYDLTMVAAAAFDLCFKVEDKALTDIVVERKTDANGSYRKIMLTVGRKHRIAPNHIVSAVAERGRIRGNLIGKIEIFDDRTIVGIPADIAEEIAQCMDGVKICGYVANSKLLTDLPNDRTPRKAHDERLRSGKSGFIRKKPIDPPPRGKLRLSKEAKERLLDGSDLERFRIDKPRHVKDRRSAERRNAHPTNQRKHHC